MYTDKQHKDIVGKMYRQSKRTQQFRLKDNRNNRVEQMNLMQSIQTIQRKEVGEILSQLNCINKISETGNVWYDDNPTNGCVYKPSNESVDQLDDKKKALEQSSEIVSKIAYSIDKSRHNKGIEWATGIIQSESNMLNPFLLKTTTLYKTANGHNVILSIYYHMGNRWSGYITKIEKKNENKHTKKIGVMNPIDSTNLPADTFGYSNIHEDTGSNSILEQTYNKSGTHAQGSDFSKNEQINAYFDSYTKLLGEGARFNCIRKNINTINDNTIIHISNINKGITFCQLWKTWGATFDKKFGITDDDIINVFVDKNYELPMCMEINGMSMTSETTHSDIITTNNKIELSPGEKSIEKQYKNKKFIILDKLLKGESIIADKSKQDTLKSKEWQCDTYKNLISFIEGAKKKKGKKHILLFSKKDVEDMKIRIHILLFS